MTKSVRSSCWSCPNVPTFQLSSCIPGSWRSGPIRVQHKDYVQHDEAVFSDGVEVHRILNCLDTATHVWCWWTGLHDTLHRSSHQPSPPTSAVRWCGQEMGLRVSCIQSVSSVSDRCIGGHHLLAATCFLLCGCVLSWAPTIRLYSDTGQTAAHRQGLGLLSCIHTHASLATRIYRYLNETHWVWSFYPGPNSKQQHVR